MISDNRSCELISFTDFSILKETSILRERSRTLVSQGNLRDARNLLEITGTLDGDGSAHEIVAEFAIEKKEIILAAQLLDYAASAKFVSSQRRRMIRETAASHILKLLKTVFANDLDRATIYEKISELRIAGRIHAEVGFWYVEKKRWSDAALHFEKGYEMRGCCSACSEECGRMIVKCTLMAIVDTVARSFNEIDVDQESEGVKNDTNADEAGGDLEAHEAVTVDTPHGEADDESFDDDALLASYWIELQWRRVSGIPSPLQKISGFLRWRYTRP